MPITAVNRAAASMRLSAGSRCNLLDVNHLALLRLLFVLHRLGVGPFLPGLSDHAWQDNSRCFLPSDRSELPSPSPNWHPTRMPRHPCIARNGTVERFNTRNELPLPTASKVTGKHLV